ncbi:hypothetical protein A1351_22640 [Methylosinus sp. R-45379]|uniref:amidohydrolase family protein n=1 Tax=Methylosinus sp. R-45379 TaxID=980563 RepID=UPI0007C9072F|nr:amidohydrolase family protein [Methylosinus sp. R-45379]OAI30578.1 hypothetical protein A1351_22640 [Methylosinus sp. R-45379]
MSELRIIDADCHVMEPDQIWVDYIDSAFRERAPRRERLSGFDWGQMRVDGAPIYRHYPEELARAFQTNIDAWYSDYRDQNFDARSTLLAMDRQGIERSYLYPSLGLGVVAIEGVDPALAAAIARAYNDWIWSFCSLDRKRLIPVPLISLHDPVAAAAEVARAARLFNARAVIVRPNPINGEPIGCAYFAPFWRSCTENGVSVAIHEGCHAQLPAAGADRFFTHFSMHTCCHPMEQMMAFLTLVENGVFETYPDLQVAFLEAGCGWVPYLLWRMDSEYRLWRDEVPAVKRPPSEYFKRQCYVSVEGCEPYLDMVIDCLGVDRLLFGTDFPHPDHAFGEEVKEIVEAPIAREAKEKILWDNPCRFYRTQ